LKTLVNATKNNYDAHKQSDTTTPSAEGV